MQLKSGAKIILPLLVVVAISTFFVFQLTRQENSANVTEQESEQNQQAKNPLPENIQVLEESHVATASANTFDTQILYNLINSHRKDHNLNKLFINKLLEDSAQRKIADMIDSEYFKHADTNNNESWYLFQAAGYQYKFAGENLSSGSNTPWQVFEAWQNSTVHNEQLLKPEYLDMGIAINCEEYKIGRNPSCLAVLHLGTR